MTPPSLWPKQRLASALSPGRLYLAVALAIFLPRVILSLVYSEVIGDGHVYLTVARNILEHTCVSMSNPATGACIPHWGGNQLPGYPAFVAASVWSGGAVFGNAATGVAQSLVAALTAMRLAYALGKYLTPARVILVVGLVLGLSPVHIAWSRLLLTESLAVSLAIWLFAELLLSHAEGRLRLLPIAVALACSVFVRYDGVLLVVPVALVVFQLHDPMTAIRRGATIALIVAVPLGVWTARSLSAGLSFPPPLTNSAGAEEMLSPQGFFSWLRTWNGNQYELQSTLWPALAFNYSAIDVPERAYVDDAERIRVLSLLRTLAAHDGAAFPPDIDATFAEMAATRRAARPWERWITTPARRLVWMSLNPLTSMGWPSDAGAVGQIRSTLARDNKTEALRIAFAHPLTTGGKLMNTLYRIVLYGLLVVVILSRKARSAKGVGLLLQMSVSYWLARVIFFTVGALAGPESRLLVEALPGLEIAVAAGALALIAKDRAGEGSA